MDFYNELCHIAGQENAKTNENMSRYTTFRAGGNAKFLVKPTSEEALSQIIVLCDKMHMPYYVVGNGSNLLVSDSGYEGLIILMGQNMSEVTISENVITAGAGALLATIGAKARDASLTGFEFAAGIPGSIGGACMMNAGAYGGEIKDVLSSVRAMDSCGNITVLEAGELDLSYRHSALADRGFIVTKAIIRLGYGDQDEISATMLELAQRRRDKQPLEYPSAGSTFKRPEGMYAGSIIEECGLKGCGVGGACVSDKHAGFVINKNNATATDIYATICLVQDTVKDKMGILLEPEVKMLGKF